MPLKFSSHSLIHPHLSRRDGDIDISYAGKILINDI